MQAQNRSAANSQEEKKLVNEKKELKQQLAEAENKRQELELQVQTMLEYSKQIKNLEVQEQSLKKLKSVLEQK